MLDETVVPADVVEEFFEGLEAYAEDFEKQLASEVDRPGLAFGGPGSGWHREDGHVKGSQGGIITHHGTSEEKLASILKNGLSLEHAGSNFDRSNKSFVYLATDKLTAQRYARDASLDFNNLDVKVGPKKHKAVVLEVHIPPEHVRKLSKDRSKTSGAGSVRFRGNVPASWIRAVDTSEDWMHTSSGRETWSTRRLAEQTGGEVIFVALILEDD